jgi:TPR repeat protein
VATGTVLLAAAQGNEYAGPLPGGNRPAFSYLTLAALRGWGDSNHDGKVTVSEATQYARRALQALLVGRHQTPDMAGPGDSVAVASAGESGPDLGDWQRMMADPSEATAPVSPTPAAGTRERASVHNEAPYANSIARVEHSASEASEVVCDVNNANGPQGCYQLGNNYNYGWNGVPEDCARAVAYYEKACASGIGQACSAIGFIFRDGKGGVAKDGRRAVAYFQRGCDAGIGNTCMALGQMFGAGGSIAKDEVRAAAIFGKTCNGGYVDACIELGEYYKDGKGVAMDRVRAAVIFERACDAGSSSGCQHLGQAYHYGHGVAPDESRAVFFLGKACDAGNRWSCQELGSRYTKGEGVVQDYARAAAWYRKGCEKGDKKACNLLNQLR